MKIVLCANTSWYLFNFRGRLIHALKEEGYSIHCVAPNDNYTQKIKELGAYYWPCSMLRRRGNPFFEILSCIQLLLILRKIDPDFVLSFTVKCNIFTGFGSYFLPYKQIANISGLGELFDENDPLRLLRDSLYKYFLSGASHIFFQNQEDLDYIVHKKRLLKQDRCFRLPGSGVDLSRFHPGERPLNRDRAKRVFLIYGRFIPDKGYEIFLKAAKHIRDQYGGKGEFWIMGSADESKKESRELFQYILSHESQGIIKYIPWTDDVQKILEQVDVVVLPTRYNEGVPRTLLEGMASGKPLIATDWKGARDTVEHGINGYLVKPGNVQDLIDNIKKFIEMPYSNLEEMGNASRQKAEKEFSEEIVIKCYLDKIHAIGHPA